MANQSTNSWMTLEELQPETGMSRSAAYKAANDQALPVPVFRFGKRFLISRAAWEAVKYQMKGSASPDMGNANEPVGIAGA